MRFEILSANKEVSDYYHKVLGIVETEHMSLLEAVNKLDAFDQMEIARCMAADIVAGYERSTPHEEIANHLAENLKVVTSALVPNSDMQRYSKMVYDLVRSDSRYQEIAGRFHNTQRLELLDIALASLTVTNFHDGKLPEVTRDQFCSLLKERWDKAEQDLLMNMPVNGTH